MGDVGPGADDLQRIAGFVVDDLERVLDPNVLTVAMAKAVLNGSASLFDERPHFFENPFRIVGMKPLRPEFVILEHFPFGKAHDGIDVLADERTAIAASCLIGVDDARRHGQKVLQARACFLELGGALLDMPFELVIGLLQLLLSPLALAQVGGEADHPNLVAVLVDKNRGRDQDGDCSPVLGPENAVESGDHAAALAHLAQNLVGARLAAVEQAHGTADDFLRPVAEQNFRALVEEHHASILVGGDDGVRTSFR